MTSGDVLLVINHINRRAAQLVEGEGDAAVSARAVIVRPETVGGARRFHENVLGDETLAVSAVNNTSDTHSPLQPARRAFPHGPGQRVVFEPSSAAKGGRKWPWADHLFGELSLSMLRLNDIDSTAASLDEFWEDW